MLVRKTGWPTNIKTFRTRRDAEDWGRRLEDEMVRGAFFQRAAGDRLTVMAALDRYLAEVVPTKRPTQQAAEPEWRSLSVGQRRRLDGVNRRAASAVIDRETQTEFGRPGLWRREPLGLPFSAGSVRGGGVWL